MFMIDVICVVCSMYQCCQKRECRKRHFPKILGSEASVKRLTLDGEDIYIYIYIAFIFKKICRKTN
jgi:hypothetical protein